MSELYPQSRAQKIHSYCFLIPKNVCRVRRGPSLGRQVGGWWIVNGGAGQGHARVRYVRLRATIIRSFYNRSQVVRKSETPICRVDRSSDMSLFAFRFDILLICVIPLVVDEAASFLVILVDWGSRRDSNGIWLDNCDMLHIWGHGDVMTAQCSFNTIRVYI